MECGIKAGADALVIHVKDHVATALKDLVAADIVTYRLKDQIVQLKLVDEISFGHKFAIQPIPLGTNVYKYGEVIGRSTSDIKPGEHVHVHNVEGIRGRGDLSGNIG